MAFIKGQPRPPNAGRKPGSKNKKKVAKVAELLAERDINPVDKILEILEEDDKKEPEKRMWPSVRAGIWFDLLSYCQAKPKEQPPDEEENDDHLLDKFKDVTDSAILKIVSSDSDDGTS